MIQYATGLMNSLDMMSWFVHNMLHHLPFDTTKYLAQQEGHLVLQKRSIDTLLFQQEMTKVHFNFLHTLAWIFFLKQVACHLLQPPHIWPFIDHFTHDYDWLQILRSPFL